MLVWRHTDDQYQTDEAETAVKVTVKGLPDQAYEISHYRIDADHSNAYTVWKSLNSPQDPTDEELAAIKARQGLEEFEPARSESTADGTLSRRRLAAPALGVVVDLEAAKLTTLTALPSGGANS